MKLQPKYKKFLDDFTAYALLFALLQGLGFLVGTSAFLYSGGKPIQATLFALFFVVELSSFFWAWKQTK